MKSNNLWKATAFVLACGLTMGIGGSKMASAGTGLNAGIFSTMDAYYNTEQVVVADAAPETTAAAPVQEDTTICGYTNLGIAQVDSSLNVRKEPDTSAEIVGKMQNDAGCEILETAGEWYKIQSGKVSGYVKAEYIITGDEAAAKAEEIKKTIATVTTQTLNVRVEMNTDCTILALMPEGEELEVTEDYGDWVQIDLDGDVGYVSKEYVEISTQLPKAQTMTELKYGQGVSDVRVSLVSYATQFVGNPYVWGGTSLTRGADCSGFVLSVYANYGVYLPHSSRAQAGCGTSISASEAQPGDLFFYSNGGGINHVAIYIGNGQIVHASSPTTGIKISNAYYRSPVKVVRVL
ncbi:MAG: C40 family peptidase [Lachnospiraceae bacterium]|nr:C40 family peptidase [Lachnospiraceae bacterium]MDE7436418.1 C40 family peptidase [Lachnospiraceae bacterium]